MLTGDRTSEQPTESLELTLTVKSHDVTEPSSHATIRKPSIYNEHVNRQSPLAYIKANDAFEITRSCIKPSLLVTATKPHLSQTI